MPLNIPDSAAKVTARAKADVQRELNQSNPFLKNSWLGAIVTASANRIYDLYLQLLAAVRDNFPDTATNGALIRWAAIWGKELLPASKSSGNVAATGIAGSLIPAGTVATVSGVGSFETTASASVSAQTINLADLTRSGTTVTATTATDHDLANNVLVTIAGAANAEYNVAGVDIVVTAADAFQYEIVGSPPDETGTSATASYTAASVPIESQDFGSAINLAAGTELKLQSPIIGVDDVLAVDFGAVGGGTDQETEEELRARLLDRIQNPVAQFNEAAIIEVAKGVAGVTRVFVQEITPAVGQVTVYFMRDNDPDPIPAGSEVALVEAAILTIKPASTADFDVFVSAPTGVPVDFTFSSLTPDTPTMRTAIEANLRQFFDERTEVGVNIDQDAYRAAIFNTVDTATGDTVLTFTLSVPAGDVTVAAGEIGTLNTVVFP